MHNILYIGADDSNHAGETYGEIIGVTFSFDQGDSVVKTFPNRRDYTLANKWLGNPQHDYLFSILMSERYRHESQNLPLIVPQIIKKKLDGLENIDNIKIYFDGRLSKEMKEKVKSDFFDFPEIVIKNFIKSNKKPKIPRLVYLADVLTNQTFREMSFEEIVRSERYVNVVES